MKRRPIRVGLRARGAPAPGGPLRRGAAHDAQREGRRRSGAGGAAARLPVLRHVRGGHQLQGLAVPHPDQRVLQSVPRARARARRDDRGGVVVRQPRTVPERRRRRRPRLRDRAARPHGLGGRREGARGRAARLQAGGGARRSRRLLVQGDRRDHGLPGRDGDEPAVSRPQDPAGPALRLRGRAGDHLAGVGPAPADERGREGEAPAAQTLDLEAFRRQKRGGHGGGNVE